MKKRLLVFTGLIIFVFINLLKPVKALDNINEISKDYEIYLENNWKQVQLSTELQNKIKKSYKIENEFSDMYPEYFGGVYISDDAKKLILQIVKDNIPSVNSSDYCLYDEIINMDENIEIEYVNNSFNDLNYVNNYISENIIGKSLFESNVKSTGLDIINNSVLVELENNSQYYQEQINEILGIKSGVIKYSNSEKATTSTNINAGGKIYLISGDTNTYCSMGMRVKYNGNNGYLTAGHCAISYSNFPSGTIQVKQFYNNQNYDYAFVKTKSSYTPTNNLQSFSVSSIPSNMTKLGLIDYCPTITVNMTISKNGVRTGYTTGKVTALNQTINYSDVNKTIKGLVKSNLYQGQGDSGCTVMIPRTDSNGGAIGLGILSGGVNLSNTMYFTNINSIPTSLQKRY